MRTECCIHRARSFIIRREKKSEGIPSSLVSFLSSLSPRLLAWPRFSPLFLRLFVWLLSSSPSTASRLASPLSSSPSVSHLTSLLSSSSSWASRLIVKVRAYMLLTLRVIMYIRMNSTARVLVCAVVRLSRAPAPRSFTNRCPDFPRRGKVSSRPPPSFSAPDGISGAAAPIPCFRVHVDGATSRGHSNSRVSRRQIN